MGKKAGNLPMFEQIGVKSAGFYADLQSLYGILKEQDAVRVGFGGGGV